jgi:uncharacterized protein YbaP (TraB family)
MLFETRFPEIQICGSIHCWDESPVSLPADALRAYQNAERIVFEADLRVLVDTHIGNYQDGIRLSNVIAPELLAGVIAACKRFDLDPSSVDGLKPWMAGLMFIGHQHALRGLKLEGGVDKYLFLRAIEDNKVIDNFETVSEQLAMFDRAPLEEQLRHLGRAVSAEAPGEAARLFAAYKNRDLRTLEDVADKALKEMPKLFSAALPERNLKWKRTILEKFNDGVPTLIVVGALHCVGATAVQEL